MSTHNRLDAHTALAEAREAVRRPDFRRTIVCGVLALAAPGAYYALGGWGAHGSRRIGMFVTIAACAVFGVIAVRSFANEVARLIRSRGGVSSANVLRWVITLTGYLIVVLEVLTMFSVPLDRLLVSGAITGVVLGIAAQQSLGNAFAGLVLLFARPFVVGDYIVLRSGALGGQYDGEVTAITLMFTKLATEDGPISLPNAGVVAAASGPRPRKASTEPAPLLVQLAGPPPAQEPAPEPPALGPSRPRRTGLRSRPATPMVRRRRAR